MSAGQKVQVIDESNRLIAAARSKHGSTPSEVVVILAPSGQSSCCRTAYLATIALGTFITSYVDTGRVCCRIMWVLVIANSNELEEAWTEISGTMKLRLPFTTLTAPQHSPSLDYARVLWFIAFLEQGPAMRRLGEGTPMKSATLFTDHVSGGDDRLPVELWWRIYGYVPAMDLVMMALVSRKHHRLVAKFRRPPYWQTKRKRHNFCGEIWLTMIQEYEITLRYRLGEWMKSAPKADEKLLDSF